MSTILELNPQDFARTQQGSCLMTATDTETGIIEPFALFDGRASGRTAVNRDGLIYDVLPYEPAFTLVDGQMVLSEEPLGENLITYSDDFSQWTLNEVTSESGFSSPDGGFNATKITDTLTDSQHYFNVFQGLPNTIQSQSIYVKYDGSQQFVQINSSRSVLDYVNFDILNKQFSVFGNSTAEITEVSDGFLRLQVTHDSSSNIDFRFVTNINAPWSESYAGTGSSIIVYGAQVEEGLSITSLIPTSGSTATRLTATGVKTPDISKWINSDGFSFSVDIKFNTNAFSVPAKTISLSDGTINNSLRIYKSNSVDNRLTFRVFKNGATVVVFDADGLALTDVNNFKIVTGNSSETKGAYVNGVLVDDWTTNDISFDDNVISYLTFSDGDNVSSVMDDGDISNIKIES